MAGPMRKYPITYRLKGQPTRLKGEATGPDMYAALANFIAAKPETISHCIYNPEHLES